MASRRTRIKGIANIPQRKKNVAPIDNPPPTTEEAPEEISKHEVSNPSTNSCQDQNLQPTNNQESQEKSDCKETPIPEPIPEAKASEQATIEEINAILNRHILDSTGGVLAEPKSEDVPTLTILEDNDTETKEPLKPVTLRRKFFPNIIKQRNILHKDMSVNENVALIPSDEKLKEVAEPTKSDSIVIHSEIIIPQPTASTRVSCDITKQFSEASPTENQPICNEELVSNVVFRNPDTLGSDTEYPGPPASPNKYNRGRIKAIPKLSLRKPSASESEDEGRRYYGRIRNNSVCSAVSVSNLEPQTPMSEDNSQKDVVTAPPKKVFRTEQSRKLAEARREFFRKFGSNNPDKQKLKMIDLIYYNPTSNPMNKNLPVTNNNNSIDTDEVEKLPERTEEEPIGNESDNDNESAFPVPQIKIGPSGEIVLDEQSLVVENTQVTRQKEQIQNSKLVDGDSSGYGVYKRAPRSSTWSQRETLRFYKALNVIGTDFTLMVQLFPQRSRRELKMKFKKEERSNLQLVDKALKDPCSYNFQDLKREVEVDQQEEAFLQKLQDEERKQVQEKAPKRAKTSKPAAVDQTNLPFKKRQSSLQSNEDQPPEKKARKKRKKKLDIKSVIEDDESVADVSDFAQSDSEGDFEEEEFIPYLKPTRSGRMPKSTLQFNEPLISFPPRPPRKPSASRNLNPTPCQRIRKLSSTSSVESNSDNLVPGSVVVTEEETAEGNSRYKVFMVTPEKKLTPLELDSSVIDRVLKEGGNVTLPLSEASVLVETNVTIVEGGVENVRPSKEDDNKFEIGSEL